MLKNSFFAKSIILFLLVLGSNSSILLYSLNPSDYLSIINSTEKELKLRVEPTLKGIDTIITNNGLLSISPRISQAMKVGDIPNSPTLYIIKELITVPSEEGFKLKNFSVSEIKSINSFITPVPEADDELSPVYSIDKQYYYDYQLPDWVSINYLGISRDRHIAELNIVVARYNPATNSIEMPNEFFVDIEFMDKSSNTYVNLNDDSFPFTLNHLQTKNWVVQNSLPQIKKKQSDKIQSQNPNNWVKITVDAEGLYRIDKNQLSSVGVDITNDLASTLKLYGNNGRELSENISDALSNEMNEIPVTVVTNSSGNFEYLAFYGMPTTGFEYKSSNFNHYINSYSNKNYYLLTWGGENGKRIENSINPVGEIQNRPQTYTCLTFFKEELSNRFISGSGRKWLGRSVFPITFTNVLHDLDRSGAIIYKYSLAHRTVSQGTFTAYESNNKLGEFSLIGIKKGSYIDAIIKQAKINLSASDISNDNRSALKFIYHNPVSGLSATPFFDWYEIQYPRSFVALENELGFFSDPKMNGITEYTVTGFNSTPIGLDVTKPLEPRYLNNISTVKNAFVFKKEVYTESPSRFFITSIYKTPTISKIKIANLRENYANADYVIITHPDLLTSAEAYKEYRSSNSDLKISIILLDDIFLEFANGMPDPTALRDFFAFAMKNWEVKPRFVMLWGDGHYDYKNITTNQINYVTTYQTKDEGETVTGTVSSTYDDYFARVAGNDNLIDFAIARMPVTSNEVGFELINKIKHYESESSVDNWRASTLLLADDSYISDSDSGNGSQHTSQSETLANIVMEQDLQQKKLYLVEYPTENIPGGRRKPRVMEDWVSVVNTSGSLLVNWIGHGNPRVLAHEEIYERSITTPQFKNLNKLFFLTAATCDFGRFDLVDIQSGAEVLLLSKIGGAIGVLSSARVVFSNDNAMLNNEFYKSIQTRHISTGKYLNLGEAMFKLKQKYYDTNSEKFFLLGDPTLKILLPDYLVKIDSINVIEVKEDSTLIELKALTEVNIACSILNPLTKEIVTDYDGIAIVTMLDSDDLITAIDDDGSQHSILKHGGALNRSSYKVKNGVFTANFIIPKDISYSNAQGRLYVYSYSDDNIFSKGATRAFKVIDLDTNIISDNKGPDISIYLDNRTFKEGDYVSYKPLLIVDLSDESGINATGLGIGHRIEAWLDDNPNSIDLTNLFTTSLENSKAGTVEKILFDLIPGTHKIKVRAWDVFNNFSVKETFFNIAESENYIIVYDIYNYPNPFDNYTTISFKHNIEPPFEAEVNIYQYNGGLIKTLKSTINTRNIAEISWDLNESNLSLSSGAYFFNIRTKTEKNVNRSKSILMILAK